MEEERDFMDRDSLKQKLFLLESEKKILKEHIRNYQKSRGIKEDTNIV